MAVEDAVTLARLLGVEREVSTAFRAYESARRRRASSLQQASYAISQASFAESGLACQLRDAAFLGTPDVALLTAFGAMFAPLA